MKEPVWLDRTDCLAIHEMMLAEHGGLAGVRDMGLLESALAKPQNWFVYGTATLPQLAASYAAGIIINHPFLDGNKRTGFLLAATFLEVNGIAFAASEESVVANTVALAAGKMKEMDYAVWLGANSSKV
jgi:death-on-curing protein